MPGYLTMNGAWNRTGIKNCSVDNDCKTYDMNMVCKKGQCVCRDLMKWNEEALECQVFIDFNCTGTNINVASISSPAISFLKM